MGGDGTTNNGLRPADFAKIDWQILGSMSISEPAFWASLDNTFPQPPVTQSPSKARVVYDEIIKCALRRGDYTKNAGVDFYGRLGLAASWQQKRIIPPFGEKITPMLKDQQELFSACMVAVLNGAGAHVPILLTGAMFPTQPSPVDIDGLFKLNEISVFGNVFDDRKSESKHLFICSEKHLKDYCGEDIEKYMRLRVCGALNGPCAVEVLGSCESICKGDAGSWQQCQGRDGNFYDNVITVKLQLSGLAALNSEKIGTEGTRHVCRQATSECKIDSECTVPGTFCDSYYKSASVDIRGCRPELCGTDVECSTAKNGKDCSINDKNDQYVCRQ